MLAYHLKDKKVKAVSTLNLGMLQSKFLAEGLGDESCRHERAEPEMAHPCYTEEVQTNLSAALLDIGNKLANPPSSTDELLSILTTAEYILSYVPQICPCHKVIRSLLDAIPPVIHALISDKIFKHDNLDIQVAVAACMNEIVRISISDYPFTDAQTKDIFGLFMVALKQLSCQSGQNLKRALLILEYMADLGSCLLMLDIKFPMDAIVIEMFLLFLNTIRLHHSADVYNHMKKIMTLIVQESHNFDHATRFNLCWTLLLSVTVDSKNTSPRSWDLGKSVMENCADRLQPLVREAVTERKLNLSDYAEIVASLCQVAPTGNDKVPNEYFASAQSANEAVETVQFVATDASEDGVAESDESSQAGQGMQIQTTRRGRQIKPNTLVNPEEGYEHARLVGSSQEEMKYKNDQLVYGQELVNLRIKVWWPIDQTYYPGTVESYNVVTKKHKIKYDDGDEEILNMSKEKWELLNERQHRQSSGEREAEPAPTKEPPKTSTKTRKRKASKKEPAGPSSKRSKSEGL